MSAGFGSRMSLGVRLSLLFAACTAAVSLIAGLIFSRAIDEHFVELDHMAMSAKLAVFRDELRGLGSEQQMRRREAELLRELARHPDLGLRLNGPDGNLWFERLPQPAHPGLPANRELGAPLEPGNDASPQLTVILDISHHQHFLQRMRQLIWLTMSLSALATALLGAWATGASLAPLRRMREVAARVSANSLTTRLDASRMPEELRGLAGELNAMLARLEEAFQRLSAFSADIAHELRTPLTSLLTQTQVVLSRPRSLEDYREALHGNLEELERLTAMVNDMLLLAKADHGLLRRVLANLLDNALRFTADGGEIRIRLGDRRLSVENQGPAIPPERLPRLFDRFYRADPARREGQGEHAGLGLAICRSIVQAHGGEIRCESADGWTRFVIDFARPRR
ncbi:heavy metal sensor histidine kinase [Pseudomonas aeruginosa]